MFAEIKLHEQRAPDHRRIDVAVPESERSPRRAVPARRPWYEQQILQPRTPPIERQPAGEIDGEQHHPESPGCVPECPPEDDESGIDAVPVARRAISLKPSSRNRSSQAFASRGRMNATRKPRPRQDNGMNRLRHDQDKNVVSGGVDSTSARSGSAPSVRWRGRMARSA